MTDLVGFGQFITEAKVSKANLTRAVELIISLIQKKTGDKFYRYGGPDGVDTLVKNGIGLLYIAKSRQAVRFNWIGGEITSITVWNNFKLGEMGDKTIELGGANLVSAAKIIVDIVANNLYGTFRTFELVEGDLTVFSLNGKRDLMEASRTSPEQFYIMVEREIKATGEDISRVSWDTITSVANQYDVQIPSLIRNARIKGRGRGGVHFWDLSNVLQAKDAQKASSDNVPDYYIKVTKRDSASNKFQSVKGDKDAEALLDQLRDAIDTESTRNVERFRVDPSTKFGHMADLTRTVCRKVSPALVITGGPGIGKSYTVMKTIKEEGLVRDQDWIMVKGKMTTSSLYETLFIHRARLIVFDDTDSVWKDGEAVNLLKGALDSYDERLLTYSTKANRNVSLMTRDEKLEYNDQVDQQIAVGDWKGVEFPSEFIFKGQIIFISNLPKSKIDSAILSRCLDIDMDFSQSEIYDLIKNVVKQGNFGNSGIPVDVKLEILDAIFTKYQQLDKNLSMRAVLGAENLYLSGIPNWKDMLYAV